MDNMALKNAYLALRRDYNDFRIVSRESYAPSRFSLLAIIRNEMYFLPSFLDHYRKLGVERFVFLNDRSDDGSFDYLLKQPDVVIVESCRTYGDKFDVPPSLSNSIKQPRILYLWRSILHDMFAMNQWALQVDLDEFIRLPEGMTFQDLIERLERQKARAVWGIMLDVYPKDISIFDEQENATQLEISANWYFDGEQHLRLRRDQSPILIYPGARARLYSEYEVTRLYPKLGIRERKIKVPLLKKLSLRRMPLRYNTLWKPTLLKWDQNSYFKSSHNTNLSYSPNHLLPIQHFRFSGTLRRKIKLGLRKESYYRNSNDHRLLLELLEIMEARNGSFLYRKLRLFESFEDFSSTRNSFGL